MPIYSVKQWAGRLAGGFVEFGLAALDSVPAVSHEVKSVGFDRSHSPSALDLSAGEIVEVRSRREILATLDREGKLDSLPFMPEMLQYCGQRFTVYKRAHKTCDTIDLYQARRMVDTVHLLGLRCDGQAHGGCQAGCLLFWKEAWLRRVSVEGGSRSDAVEPRTPEHVHPELDPEDSSSISEAELARATRVTFDPDHPANDVYQCQATELKKASMALIWWDPRQYVRDLTSGNVSLLRMLRAMAIAAFNVIQRRRSRRGYPFVRGVLTATPRASLDLRPGELVRVKSKEAIVATLDRTNRNRGMWFDVEMVPYCGGTFRVLRRVERIVNEKTGKMLKLPNDCIILDGVTCGGHFSRDRLFCPRSIYPYWREIWLERAESTAPGEAR